MISIPAPQGVWASLKGLAMKKFVGLLLVVSGTIMFAYFANAIKEELRERRAEEKEEDEEILARLYALKMSVLRAHEGRYQVENANEIMDTDFKFSRIVYFLDN